MLVEASFLRLPSVFLRTPSRQSHDHRLRPGCIGPNSSRDLVAVNPRQADVKKQHVGPLFGRDRESVLARMRDSGRVAGQVEHRRQQLSRVDVVINDEYPQVRAA